MVSLIADVHEPALQRMRAMYVYPQASGAHNDDLLREFASTKYRVLVMGYGQSITS